MDNKCDCDGRGYLHVDTYGSTLIDNHFLRKPEDKSEVDAYLQSRQLRKEQILLALCVECDGLRIRMKSKMDRILESYQQNDRRSDFY